MSPDASPSASPTPEPSATPAPSPIPDPVPTYDPVMTTTAITQIVDTKNGSFDFVQSVTLGDCLIALSVMLLLVFQVMRWLLDTVWRGGNR